MKRPDLTSPAHSVAAPDEGQVPIEDGPRWVRCGELGAGGMGRVALVHDAWLGREVALKEPVSAAEARRLRREGRLTARLEHPGIVPIYDMGLSPDGQPWFAMRVARGRSLDAILAEAPAWAERMRLLRHLVTACEAVAFAHARGIVHRDLKPANLMIGAFGETFVLDWGLALAPGLDAAEEVGLAGTPRAMSPEQARGEPVGPASDVWSLGAVLYEVVAGVAPFPQATREQVLAAIRAGHAPPLPGDVPVELAAVIDRALASLPGARYPDARALADDLSRYLDGRRVEAHSYSAWQLVRRLARLWRVPLLIGAAALAVIAVLLVVAVSRVGRQRDLAELNLAQQLAPDATRALRDGRFADAAVLAANALARAPLPEARAVLASLPAPPRHEVLAATLPCTAVDVGGGLVLCDTAGEVSVVDGGRTLWRRAVAGRAGEHSMIAPGDRVATFLERGRLVAITSYLTLEVLDARTGIAVAPAQPNRCNARPRLVGDDDALLLMDSSCAIRVDRGGVYTLPSRSCRDARGSTAALHPDGQHYAVACHSGEILFGRFPTYGSVGDDVLTTVETGLIGEHEITALAFVPGSDALLAGTIDGGLTRLHPTTTASFTRESLWRGHGPVARIVVTPDARRAVVQWDLGEPGVFDLTVPAYLGGLLGHGATALAVNPDGSITLVGTALERWDFAAVHARAVDYPDGVGALDFSTDGALLAVGHGPWLTVLDTATRTVAGTLRWQDQLVMDVHFTPDGTGLVADGIGAPGLREFAATPPFAARATFGDRISRCFAVLADGSALAAVYSKPVERWRAGAPAERFDARQVLDIAASPDGRRVAALGTDNALLAGAAGGPLRVIGKREGVRAIIPDPESDGVIIAVGDGVEVDGASYATPGADVLAVAATRGWIAAGARDGTVWLWRRGEREARAVFHDHTDRVDALAFDPAGRWLASGGWSGHVAIYALPGEDARPDERRAEVERTWGKSLAAVLPGRDAPPANDRDR